MIDPGKLDRRVVVQNYTTSNDVYGQSVKTWANYRTRWASIDYRAGQEKIEQGKITAVNKVYFILRYERGYSERMRILYNLEYFYFTAVSPIGRERYVEFETEKRGSREIT